MPTPAPVCPAQTRVRGQIHTNLLGDLEHKDAWILETPFDIWNQKAAVVRRVTCFVADQGVYGEVMLDTVQQQQAADLYRKFSLRVTMAFNLLRNEADLGKAWGLEDAGTHPRVAVLPIGAMAALAMSAIGGCWWPLDFEPYWMRAVALVMPTTWTMEAFNNLMIRGPDPSSVAWPAAVTFAIGMVFLGVGILSSSRIYLQAGQ